jgi:hypothetical protein
MSNCKKCKCVTSLCGCEDIALTTNLNCLPVCPNPEPCAETFSDCCIIHNNDAFVYITDTDDLSFSILQGERLCDTLQRLTIEVFGKCSVPYVYGLKSTSITSSTINVVWTPVPLADSYTVYYATVAGMSWSNSGPITASTSPTYTITGLSSNTPYYVYVTVTIDGVESCRSVSLIITTLN